MKSRKYTGAVLSLFLIAALLLVFTGPLSNLWKKGERINLKSPERIDRISLWDASDSVWLDREGDSWLLFGTEPVNPVAVENLLFAAEHLQITSIVSSEPLPGHGQGRKVRYYEGGKTVVEYGFESRDGKYLVWPDGSDLGFYVSVSGYGDVYLEKVFSSTADHYREHLLMELIPSEISRIEIELQGGQGFQFTQNDRGRIACLPANEATVLPAGPLDTLAVRLLFSYFTSLSYEQRTEIDAEGLLADGVLKDRMARILVESNRGEKHILQVFPYHESKGAGAHMFKALVIHNDDPGVLLVNYIYLDVLMRDVSHYFGEK